jgi:hypothetical protein
MHRRDWQHSRLMAMESAASTVLRGLQESRSRHAHAQHHTLCSSRMVLLALSTTRRVTGTVQAASGSRAAPTMLPGSMSTEDQGVAPSWPPRGIAAFLLLLLPAAVA